MSTPSHDVIVIGAGPAGLTAAAGTAQAGLKTLCLDKLAPGGALINLGELHDVEHGGDGQGGDDQGSDGHEGDGPQIAAQLTDAATDAGVELGFGEVVTLTADGGAWTVETAEGDRHTARAVVIATGLNKGTLGLPEESRYEGLGLSHCASCDGPLYAGRPVVVAGAEGWALRETAELQTVAGDVTLVAASAAEPPAGVNHIAGRIVALQGDDGLEAIVVETGGVRKTVPASAVFVYVGQSPAAEFVPEMLARDATGHIVVDNEGCTSAAGVFAAGDVRSGGGQRLREAIADGERAAKAVVTALKTD